jgi:hypothetical protein
MYFFFGFWLIGMFFFSCLQEQTQPNPSIWMNKKVAIHGDTLIFRDNSINSSGRKWFLPDRTVSDQYEVIFPTFNVNPGYHAIDLFSLDEGQLSIANQKKFFTVHPKSWVIINLGNRVDTIEFRMQWTSSGGGNKFFGGLKRNLFGEAKNSFEFSLYQMNYPGDTSYMVVSYALLPTEAFPPITLGVMSFRGLFQNVDSGIVGVINPTNSGVVKRQGSRFEFENISAQYVSISSNQAGDTIPVLLKGVIHAKNFDYIPE